MSEVTRRMIARVAVDIAKQVIHVHAFDGAGAQPRQPRPTSTNPNTRILPPKTCFRSCNDRSSRQLVNSGFTNEMAITPNLGIEWSPTERFVDRKSVV